MFKHLLVPLDGSHLAESALPYAARMAEKLDASITLIHVIEEDAPKEIHHEHHLTEAAEAEAYLSAVARRAFPPGVPVAFHVHTSQVKNVARSIVEHTGELEHDLVVMCTHGNGGPRDWFLGNIAQQIIALGGTPVLLVPPREGAAPGFPCGRILVPLDGVPDHEQGLQVAASLAKGCEMNLYLLMVIPTRETLKSEKAATGRMLPGAMSALLDLAEQGGRDYLRAHLDQLKEREVLANAEIARGDPATVILDTVRRVQPDLIVLGTHGKTGMDAFWSGSVTPKLSSRADIPILLVPVHDS